MQGIPGFMLAEPSFPPVHVRPLVQVGPHPVPAGDPAATQFAIVATSPGVGGVDGGGGMGIVVDCIRATATAATDCAGSNRDGAIIAATLVSDGTPGVGVRPWQAQHRLASTISTSHGRSVAAGLS